MKTLYIDCSMGAAGDMLTAALLSLFNEKETIVKELNALNIPGVEYRLSRASRCGISGDKMDVFVNGETEGSGDHDHDHGDHGHSEGHEHHEHRGLHGIEDIVEKINISGSVRQDILSVYGLLADAESKVHGVPVTEIHFHEVGHMDAVADIAAVCFLINRLSPEKILAGPVNTGSGTVRCAHGILPVPAPATAELLRGIPAYNDGITGELTTPTGAALLKHFVTDFGDMPEIRTEAIGYGMGNKDFERANCVRILLGETVDKAGSKEEPKDSIALLSCNIDDMTGEEIGFAVEELINKGALDVFTSPIGMKKGRPGVLLSVICRKDKREEFARLIFDLTTTIGIRESVHERYVLNRDTDTVSTRYGELRIKRSSGYGVVREKYEYEDVADIARKNGTSLRNITEKPQKTS